jgi:regulator of cell morphogenesis and NO signaling
MTITSETPVREIATAIPTAIPVLEQLGIDYCCGGQHTLAEACSTHNIAVARALDELERLQKEQGASVAPSHWLHAPLNELTEHIVQKHHAFTRNQLKLIDDLMAKVEQRHGAEHVEVFQLGKAIAVFGSELRHHAECEEANLFPFIAGLETGQKKDLPAPAKGSVKMPITRMMADHDQTGEELQTLRKLTDNYTPPAYACPTWQALYRAIEELDADLHTHIHLENNILFPRALEKAGAEQPVAACA